MKRVRLLIYCKKLKLKSKLIFILNFIALYCIALIGLQESRF